MSSFRLVRVSLWLCVAALVFAVVASSASGRRAAGTLNVGLINEDKTLIPLGFSTDPVLAAHNTIESLASFGAGNKLHPQLATKWKQTSPKSVSISLRKGVRFTDGEPFNASTVIFSWHWVLHELHGTDAQYFNEIKSIKVRNPHSIVIKLSKPDPLFIEGLSALWMYPPKLAGKEGYKAFGRHPVGTGPFVFQKWVRGSSVTFIANQHYYHQSAVKLAKIVYRFIPDTNARVAALKSGQIDIAYDISPELAPGVARTHSLKIEKALDYHLYNLEVNNLGANANSPVAKQKVRLALNYAIDKRAIVSKILHGYAKVSSSFIGPAMFGYNPKVKAFPYNPAKAKKLLAQAGYPSGFSIDYSCPSDAYTDVNQICQAIDGYLQAVGIKTNFTLEDGTTYWNAELAKTPTPLFYEVWGDLTSDPGTQIQGAFAVDPKFLPAGAKLPSGIPSNQWANYWDPKLMALYNRYLGAKTIAGKKSTIFAFAKYTHANPPFAWLFQIDSLDGVNKRVHGFIKFNTELDDTMAGVSLSG